MNRKLSVVVFVMVFVSMASVFTVAASPNGAIGIVVEVDGDVPTGRFATATATLVSVGDPTVSRLVQLSPSGEMFVAANVPVGEYRIGSINVWMAGSGVPIPHAAPAATVVVGPARTAVFPTSIIFGADGLGPYVGTRDLNESEIASLAILN